MKLVSNKIFIAIASLVFSTIALISLFLYTPSPETESVQSIQNISNYDYFDKNLNKFERIKIHNSDNAFQISFKFIINNNNDNYTNLFQTDDANKGVRLELLKSEIALIVHDNTYSNNYHIVSFSTPIKIKKVYDFNLILSKELGYIVSINDEVHTRRSENIKPSLNNFFIGKGYDNKRIFEGKISNVNISTWFYNLKTHRRIAKFRNFILTNLIFDNADIDEDYINNYMFSNKESFYEKNVEKNIENFYEKNIENFYEKNIKNIENFYKKKTENFYKNFQKLEISSEKIYILLLAILICFTFSIFSSKNNFFKNKIKKIILLSRTKNYFFISLLIIFHILILYLYDFYNFFILMFLYLFIVGFSLYAIYFPKELKCNLSNYIFPPILGLIVVIILGGYSICFSLTLNSVVLFSLLVSILIIFQNKNINSQFNELLIYSKNNALQLLSWHTLIVTPLIFLLCYPILSNGTTSFVRIGPDMFFYAKMAQFLIDGGLLDIARERANEFSGLSTGEINKYSDATASWPFMYMYRWGLGFYQFFSSIIHTSRHSYEIVFLSMIIPYFFLSSIVFFWLYKKQNIGIVLSLMGFIIFSFNSNILNLWFEGFYGNVFSLFIFCLFILIFSYEKEIFEKKDKKILFLYTLIFISMLLSYSEGVFFVLGPLFLFLIIYDLLVKKEFNFLAYKNIVVSGIIAIILILPAGFFVEWVITAIKQIFQEGGNGYMQPKWALPHEIFGISDIYKTINLTNGGVYIPRENFDIIFSSIITIIILYLYRNYLKNNLKKVNSLLVVPHILVFFIFVYVYMKSHNNNYMYMKYYIFMLPYLFLLFWTSVTNFELANKNKYKICLILLFLTLHSGFSYIYKYTEQARFVKSNKIEFYEQSKKIDFNNVIIYPTYIKTLLNSYPALIKVPFVTPKFEFKHSKNFSSRKVYILAEKYEDNKLIFPNLKIIFENNSFIILDSGLLLNDFLNIKNKKVDFNKLSNIVKVE